ncbi:MAG: hypothetical protein HY927_08520 [Elusimicrobia bacterium]|nr:hypothetical protein [Elusimicrobiota bacterium]
MLTLREKVKDSLTFKLLQSLRRFLSGLGGHLRDTALDMAVVVAEHRRDRELGIRTNLPWRRHADESRFGDMQPYDPISYAAAEKILAFLDFGPKDVFIDLGCGQGRAVFLAATRRPRKAVGVELNADLFRIAMENKRTFRGGGGWSSSMPMPPRSTCRRARPSSSPTPSGPGPSARCWRTSGGRSPQGRAESAWPISAPASAPCSTASPGWSSMLRSKRSRRWSGGADDLHAQGQGHP